MKKSLIIGLAAGAVVMAGGTTALVLALNKDQDDQPQNNATPTDQSDGSRSGDSAGGSALLAGAPSNPDELVAAIENRQAIDCSYNMEMDGSPAEVIYQIAAGGEKHRVRLSYDGQLMNALHIENDAIYIWGEVMGQETAMKLDWATMQELDPEAVENFDPTSDVINGKETIKDLVCQNPSGADFAVPEQEWLDLGEMMQGMM